MGMPWFRLYAEFAYDPKVQMMPEHMQRRLVMLFCFRCIGNVSETLHETHSETHVTKRMFHDAEIAFQLRISEHELNETKELFLSKGFIDSGWNVLNWDKRQYVSDTSTERVRAYRNRKKKHVTNETFQKRCETVTVTAPDTDTDTDTDTDIYKNHLASTDEKRRSKPKNENAPHNRISFNFETFQWVGITESDISAWHEAYPACDIRSELVKAREWVKSNPSKRKKNWYKFLTGWISRTQEKGGSFQGKSNLPKTVEQELMERGYKNCNHRSVQ